MARQMRGSGATTILGLGVLGALIVGIAGIVLALFAVIGDSDYAGAGLCLIGAALAFGVVAGALSIPGSR